MAKAAKQPKEKEYKEKLAIKGSFLDAFKVVKKDNEKRIKEGKK